MNWVARRGRGGGWFGFHGLGDSSMPAFMGSYEMM